MFGGNGHATAYNDKPTLQVHSASASASAAPTTPTATATATDSAIAKTPAEQKAAADAAAAAAAEAEAEAEADAADDVNVPPPLLAAERVRVGARVALSGVRHVRSVAFGLNHTLVVAPATN